MPAQTPDIEAFKAGLARDGYRDVEEKTIKAGLAVGRHSHPYDVRALVLDGQATIDCDGEGPRTYRPGDVLVVARDVPHTEDYGSASDYRVLVGRRHPG